MRGISLCLALLFAGATLSAQVKTGESPALPAGYPTAMPAQVKLGESPTVLFASPNSTGCPIGMVAERQSAPIVSTVGNASPVPSTQAIQLRFRHYPAPNIEQVTVIVHGLSGKSRMMPANSADSNDVEESFQLTRAADASSLTASYVRPTRVRTTQWIELTRVEYADGTTWRASREAQCTITPNNFVLVSAR